MSQFLTDRKQVEAWLDSMYISSYYINEDLTVDVQGSVDLTDFSLANLPIRFGKVHGSFSVAKSQLTSFDGFPRFVGGSCFAGHNQITSLVGRPDHVGNLFSFTNNKIMSLEGLPGKVGGIIQCYGNTITSRALLVFQVDDLSYIEGLSEMVTRILNKHLPTKDIFACQQELIDNDLAEWATL